MTRMKNPLGFGACMRFLIVGGLFVFTCSAQGQNATWNGSTDTNWSSATNWTGTAPASSTSRTLFFDTANLSGAENQTANNDLTGFTANGATAITFSNTKAGTNFTLTGNQITLDGNILVNATVGSPGPLLNLGLLLSGNRTVTVDAGASAEIGGQISESGSRALTKAGNGALRLSSGNTFTGGLVHNGGIVLLAHNSAAGSGKISINNTAGTTLLLGSNVTTLANDIEFHASGASRVLGLETGATAATLTGNIQFNATGGNWINTAIRALTGETLNVSGNITGSGFHTTGAGTVVLSGSNSNTSATSAYLGTLRLDYSTNNNKKLGASMTLGGATVELSGGSYAEVTGNISMNPGATRILRSSGTSTIQFGSFVFGSTGQGATVDFVSPSFLTANASSLGVTTSPRGRMTVNGTDWAVTTATGNNVGVVAYSAYTNIANGGNMANSSSNHYLLSDGGTVGLASADTAVGTILLKTSTAATINLAGNNLLTNGIMIANGGGNLTVGASVGDGTLTRTSSDDNTQLSLLNYSSTATLRVNSLIVNNTSTPPFVTKSGTGLVELTANNAYTGPTFANEGTLLISGGHSGNGNYEVRGELAVNGSIGTGTVTVYDGGQLSGEGTINGATTLQLGAKLSAGYGSADTLTFANGLDLSATAGRREVFAFTLGSTSDLVDVTGGTLNIGSGLLNFDSFAFTLSGPLNEQDYVLFQSTDLNGSLALGNLTGDLGGGFTGTLGLDGDSVILTVVPEPNAFLLVLSAGGFTLLRRRRRRAL
jgi:fibronectin-binding autotransporter adhesin